jgi:hypothetical protein
MMVIGFGEWGSHHQEYAFCRESNSTLNEVPAIVLSIFSESIYILFLLPIATPPSSTYMPSLSPPPSTTLNPIPTPLHKLVYSIPPPIPPSTHARAQPGREKEPPTRRRNRRAIASLCGTTDTWNTSRSNRRPGNTEMLGSRRRTKEGKGKRSGEVGWEFLYGKFLAGG